MGPLLRALRASTVATALALAPGVAHAHWVPGDSDSGRSLYLLPGPLVSLVAPFSGGRGPLLMDLGVELSLHRFVPTSGRLWSQFGYGAFVQVQAGGIVLQQEAVDESSVHLRLAVGAQGSYGPFGAHAGLATRVLSETRAGMVGGFAGLFLSVGIITASFAVELPFAHVGDGGHHPVAFIGAIILKWPVTIATLPAR